MIGFYFYSENGSSGLLQSKISQEVAGQVWIDADWLYICTPAFQHNFVPNKKGYVGMAVVWLTVPTLLLKLINVAVLIGTNVGSVSQTTAIFT